MFFYFFNIDLFIAIILDNFELSVLFEASSVHYKQLKEYAIAWNFVDPSHDMTITIV